MLLPATGLVGAAFGGGLFFAVAESLGFFAAAGADGFTFENFARAGRDPEARAAIFLTFFVTVVATLVSAVGGALLAVGLRESMRRSAALKTLLQIPLAVPHLAVALILLGVLAPSGFVARVFSLFGAIDSPSEFPVLVNDAYGAGIVLAYVLKETPFIALMILTVLARVGDEYETAAQNLGASRWQRFRFVTLPLVLPPLVFSSLLAGVFVFGAYEVPLVLGRIYPSMLAVAAHRKFGGTDLGDRPEAMALAVLMTLATMVAAAAYLKFSERLLRLEKTSIF